jgi:spermidine synthase
MLAVRVAVAAVVVLPAACAMGVSFPALGALAGRLPGTAAGYLTRLYATNLLGAAAACVLAPYVFFPLGGLWGGLELCSAINLGVAFFAWQLAEFAPFVRCAEQPAASARAPGLLGLAFLSGLLFFALEVVWTQVIAVVVNSSVYAFSSMLFFVTLGLGLGARSIHRAVESGRQLPELGQVLQRTAMLVVVQSLVWPFIPVSMASIGRHVESFFWAELVRWLHVAGMLLPVAYRFGMLYPLLLRDPRLERDTAARLAGQMGALNSLGCVLGAAVALFALIPGLGSDGSLRLVAALLAACGAALALRGEAAAQRWRRGCFGAMLAAVALLLPGWPPLQYASGINLYFAYDNVTPESRLLFAHEDGYGGVTTVVENPTPAGAPRKVLLTNGKFQGDDGGQTYAQIGFAALPALHLATREDALAIGFGTGQSAAVLRELDFRHLDIAEISPGILEGARRHFPELNRRLFEGARTRIHLEDGRNVLLTTTRRYDLVSIEITSVWFAGATNLYSREFYELVRSRLHKGGVFQQWIQLHHISSREIRSMLGTLRSVFPWVTVWMYGGQGIVLAANEPRGINERSREQVHAYLKSFRGGDPAAAGKMLAALETSLLLDSAGVESYLRPGFEPNTDWNRFIEYATPRYNLSRADWMKTNLAELRSHASAAPPGSPDAIQLRTGGEASESCTGCAAVGRAGAGERAADGRLPRPRAAF